ncbi:MAG: carbohydrate kinase family protein [Thermoproteota archaeon]|nr:carbohydrate kinase family protein [Thermoproteota archaeon]
MAVNSSDLAVIGHFSMDTLLLPAREKPFNILGGTVAYTSFAARRLDASVSVISRVGSDFPQAYLWLLEQEGIDTTGILRYSEENTTSFELAYTQDFTDRTLKLKSKGHPLTLGDIPKVFHVKASHIGPIANEVPYEVVEEIKKHSDTLSIDPQGMLRSFDKEGNVVDNGSIDNEVFSLVNIYKSSERELCMLTGESELKPAIRTIHDVGIETVIVTLGAKGAVLSVEGTQYNIAACPSQVVIDPTGAGDVFIGAFITEYIRQKESLWCAAVASAAASLVVEGLGSTYFGKKEEIYRRANLLYEKELKQ